MARLPLSKLPQEEDSHLCYKSLPWLLLVRLVIQMSLVTLGTKLFEYGPGYFEYYACEILYSSTVIRYKLVKVGH